MNYEVFDNFLPKEEFKPLQDFMLSYDCPWYYNEGVSTTEDDHFQFIHNFFNNGAASVHLPVLEALLNKIGPSILYRAKGNLLTKTLEHVEHGWHYDFDPEDLVCKTAVFYINTNNGYTKFKDGPSIESIENRLIVFDSPMAHTGASQTDTNARVVINLNFDL